MKYLLLLSFGVSLSVVAQDQALLKNFKIIDEINGKSVNYKACSSDDPNAPEYCKNLYNYVCAQKKVTNKKDVLERELTSEFWRKMPTPLTYKVFNDMAKKVHKISEDSVYDLTGLTRKDIEGALTDVKSSLHKFINSTKLIKNEYKKDLVKQTGDVKLLYGQDYVEVMVQYGKQNSSGADEEYIRTEAYKLYMSACGVNGLEVNAFYQGGRLVLCPGLIISAAEYGRSKAEVLAGLKFTIGHEVAHSIDAEEFPDIYNKMQKCYEDITNNKEIFTEMSAEISADYWGALTLGEKLDPKNPDKNARIVALSVDGFCVDPEAGSPHPEGVFRINQILAKHPYIARALNCAPSEKDAPYCSLNGAYTP